MINILNKIGNLANIQIMVYLGQDIFVFESILYKKLILKFLFTLDFS